MVTKPHDFKQSCQKLTELGYVEGFPLSFLPNSLREEATNIWNSGITGQISAGLIQLFILPKYLMQVNMEHQVETLKEEHLPELS